MAAATAKDCFRPGTVTSECACRANVNTSTALPACFRIFLERGIDVNILSSVREADGFSHHLLITHPDT